MASRHGWDCVSPLFQSSVIGSLPAVLPSTHGTKSLDGSLHHHANVKAYLQQTMQQVRRSGAEYCVPVKWPRSNKPVSSFLGLGRGKGSEWHCGSGQGERTMGSTGGGERRGERKVVGSMVREPTIGARGYLRIRIQNHSFGEGGKRV